MEIYNQPRINHSLGHSEQIMKITTYIYRTIAFAGLLLAGAMPLRAQLTSYYCDFEDAQERNAWVCNAGPQGSNCVNQWYIGSLGNFSENGQNGLYISADDGATSSYTTANASSVVVYREIDLQTGTYFLDFDWRALGLKNASIVVFWVPKSIPTNSNPNSGYSSQLDQYRIGGDSVLYGAITWQSVRFTLGINSNNQDGKLVFIWNCAKNGAAPNLPAACIDNISITPYTEDCEKPEYPKDNKGNITAYDKNTATLSWTKGSGVYQVRDYNMEDGKVVFYDAIQQNSVQLKTFTEGYHVFSVRSVCGKDSFSEWESVSEFIWIPGNRCVDYMDLEQATCYYGSFEKPYEHTGVIDKGYNNKESRHTIHYVKGETDPRTENKLKTIPDGEIASVRLGNWKPFAEAEAIEYKYPVQGGQSDIMELKYAIILEKPTGHSREEKPHFLLDIFDNTGEQIGKIKADDGTIVVDKSGCFSADFAADTEKDLEGWNEWFPENSDNASIVWKDWTTLSISLRDYIGQTLTIRFTTQDCSLDGHYGYAYFTIGCRSGDLEGIACGDFETDHFDAPEGFNYEWRKVENDSLITDTGRPYVDGNVLHIDKSDTCIYAVEVISKMGDHCSYTLTANPNPRFPKAEVTGQERVENCTNYADFTNASHIYFINRQNGSLSESKEPVEDVIWDFGDGYPLVHSTASTLTHEYPASGGKFTAKAIASMSNGVCQDTALIEIDLPDLSAGNDTYIDKCMGESYTLPTGVEVTQDTIYTFDEKNQHGCDAASHIIVRFHKQKTDTVDAAICEGETYTFEDNTYTKEGQYTENLVSAAGCDSLRTLNLTVYPKLIVDVQDTISLCADEPALIIPYDHKQGRLDSVEVHLGNIRVSTGYPQGKDSICMFMPDEEIRIPLPSDITPQDYPLTVSFLSSECPMEPVRIVARIRYAAAVIEQKNDLIALLNADYNGGFSWSGYQWYCNGTPVPGAETSYIVVGDEHLGDEYYCLLTREDGTLVSTCPITYAGGKTPIENVTDRQVYPTLISAGENLHIVGETAVTIVDVLGNHVAAYRSQEGQWTFPAPARSGLYFILNTRQIIARIIVH